MSPVERVRETARLMRERAKAARASLPENVPDWHSVRALGEGKTEGDATHIASLDPEVARRIAAWLEQSAAFVDEAGDGPLAILAAALIEPAVAVADAYLEADA